MRVAVVVFILVFSSSLWARPSRIEMWFLTSPSVSHLHHLVDRYYAALSVSKNRIAEAETVCLPMGDQCFDPQIGLYDPKDHSPVSVEFPDVSPEKSELVANPDADLIKCDKDYMFDLFCGEAKRQVAAVVPTLEVWIDTSSSLRESDPGDGRSCYRRRFAEELQERCSSANLSSFDSQFYPNVGSDVLCTTSGLNDQAKLIDWIEQSTAKTLIIITDIPEYSKKISDYIEQNGGKIVGSEGRLSAKDLMTMVDGVAAYCK